MEDLVAVSWLLYGTY